MLRTRVITALILAAGLFAAVLLLDTPRWAWIVAAVAGLGGWEFGRLCRWKSASPLLGMLVFAVAALLIWRDPAIVAGSFGGSRWVLPILSLSALFWFLLGPFWLKHKWALGPGAGLLAALVILLPTWLAIVQLHALHPWLLIASMAFVSFADIAAYFSGRKFGRRKLAPEISPGKTWEGVYGAFVVTSLFGVGVASAVGWVDGIGRLIVLLLLCPLLTLVSIEGDLLESLLKRRAGMKDSSQLLPGHGGILDRIDSLTAALPLVALAILLVP